MKTSPAYLRPAAFFAIVCLTWSVAQTQTALAQPLIVVEGGTPGFYNNSLGTILDGSAPQFPQPLGIGGDPLIYPSDEPNLAAATNQLGNWLAPHSTLNANWQPMATIPATWSGNTETAIIYEVNGGANGFTNLFGSFDADNGIYVWVNGQFKFGARAPGLPSPAGQFEYPNVYLGNLAPGTNRIQILREDSGVSTGYQIRITGNPLGGAAQTCVPVPPGLVSWWRGEGNGADAVGTNTGSLVNGVGFGSGPVGQAFAFDGIDDFVRIPASPSLDVGAGNGFTIETWIKPLSVVGQQPLVEWNNGLDIQTHFWISVPIASGGTGSLYANLVDFANVSHPISSLPGLIVANTYQHVAMTYDKLTGLCTLYLNGSVVAQANLGSFTPDTRPNLFLGHRPVGAAANARFGGGMDEVSLYNRALSLAEIQAIYSASSAGKCAPTNPPCTPAPTGLVSWWRAEGNAVDTTGTNSGSLVNGTGFGSGKVGQAFSFDGIDDSVRIPASASLDDGTSGGLTIETWIKPSRLTIGPIAEWNNGAGGEGAHFWHSIDSVVAGDGPGNLYGNLVDTSGVSHQLTSPSGLLATNAFNHVALTYDKTTGVAVIYHNGVAVKTANLGIFTPRTGDDLHLGKRASGPFSENLFQGLMDEASLYNRALTSNEIAAIYAADGAGKCPPPPPPSCLNPPAGLAGWWRADGNGLDSADGNNGAVLNGAGFAAGKVGQAFSFDGINDHFRVADRPNLRLTTGLTVEAWIYPTSLGANRAIVSKWDAVVGPDQRSYSVALQPDGRAYLAVSPTGTGLGATTVFSSNSVPVNEWTYLAVTYDGAALRMYLNGVIQDQTPYTQGIFSGTSDLGVGANVGGTTVGDVSSPFASLFAGMIDELGIYNHALSASEIAAIYHAGSAGKCPLPPPPTVTQQPQDQTVNANATAQFTVAASGTPPLRYQWFFAGNPLPNATNASLSIPNALPVNAGSYFVAVSNDFGFAISSNATLTVLAFPPVITRQPTNVTAIESTAASFSVQATGSVTLAYQWLFNDAPLAGKTGTTLSFTSAQFSNAGNYSVIVTNPYGAVTSSVATLTVNPRPPCAPVHDGLVSWWRWENDGTDSWDSNNGNAFRTFVAGKVGRAYTGAINLVPDAASLRVTNAITLEAWVNPSSVSGSTPRIIVSKFDYPLANPVGTQSAYLLGTTNNGLLFFTVSATGSARTNTTLMTTQTLPINQWTHVAATYDGTALRLYLNGTQAAQTNYSGGIFPGTANLGIGGIPFGTSPLWLFSGLLDEVSLYNRALSAAEIQSIFNADLTGKCLAPPVITQQPQSQSVPLGEDVRLTATVVGSRPLKYQWQSTGPAALDFQPIIGATNAVLVLEKLRVEQARIYRVAVTNAVGFAISALAQVSLLPAPSCTDIMPGLISWWPGDGNTADVMGANNIASYSPATYPTGKVERAFTFNGINSRITINTTTLEFGSNRNFSIEMWIKATPTNTTYPNVPLFEKRHTFNPWWGYSLSLYNGRLAFALSAQNFSSLPVTMYVSSSPDLRDGMFHHVAVTLNRSATNGGVLYVDGLPALVFDPTSQINSLANQNPLYIGAPATTISNSFFNGLIDEPAIYNRALTAGEILAIRQAGAAGKCKVKPSIIVQPVSQRVTIGSNATFSVTATGTPLLRYQWLKLGQAIQGATASTYSFPAINSVGLGLYSVRVTNLFGTVTSSNAELTVNHIPTIDLHNLSLNEDTPTPLRFYISDLDQDPLTLIMVTPPSHGTLSGTPPSNLVYTPTLNYFGPDTFIFKVNDGLVDSAPATVSITVTPVNDPPTAASQIIATDEDTPLPIALGAYDVDGDALTFSVNPPAHGTLSGTPPNLVYTPATNYFGDDLFTFTVSDPSNAVSQLAAVSITVRSVNDAPVAKIVLTPLDELPGVTNLVAIAPVCCDATLRLDASQSSDVENDPLTYAWLEGTNVLSTDVTATNRFKPGTHEITLLVSDGTDVTTAAVTVEIITPAEAVDFLKTLVEGGIAERRDRVPLVNWLREAGKAFERCHVEQGVRFLELFKQRVQDRIAPTDAELAAALINTATAIMEAAPDCDPCHRLGRHDHKRGKDQARDERDGHGNSGKDERENQNARPEARPESTEVRAERSSPKSR